MCMVYTLHSAYETSCIHCTVYTWRIHEVSSFYTRSLRMHDQTWYIHYAQRIHYGVASISRLLEIIGLFCKRALQKRLYSAKETYHFKEPTNRQTLYTFAAPPISRPYTLQHTATHCDTLQHTATLCSTLQHTAAHCSMWYLWYIDICEFNICDVNICDIYISTYVNFTYIYISTATNLHLRVEPCVMCTPHTSQKTYTYTWKETYKRDLQ